MKSFSSFLVLALIAAAMTASAQQYPLRPKYPQTTPISTEQMAQEFASSVVVDVRSDFEFSVMHVDGAIHIDLSDPAFLDKLGKAVDRDKSKLVITYCNGTTRPTPITRCCCLGKFRSRDWRARIHCDPRHD